MEKLCRDFSRKLIHSRWIFDELLISNPHEFIPRDPCRIIRVSLNLDELVRVSMKFWQIRSSKFLQVLLEFFSISISKFLKKRVTNLIVIFLFPFFSSFFLRDIFVLASTTKVVEESFHLKFKLKVIRINVATLVPYLKRKTEFFWKWKMDGREEYAGPLRLPWDTTFR